MADDLHGSSSILLIPFQSCCTAADSVGVAGNTTFRGSRNPTRVRRCVISLSRHQSTTAHCKYPSAALDSS